MHYTEIIFFGCFIVFIVGILMLDMLVIDKEAHEVSMKEAGCLLYTSPSPRDS